MSRRALSLSSFAKKPLTHRIHGRQRMFSASAHARDDPRIPKLGREMYDDFAQLRDHYGNFLAFFNSLQQPFNPLQSPSLLDVLFRRQSPVQS